MNVHSSAWLCRRDAWIAGRHETQWRLRATVPQTSTQMQFQLLPDDPLLRLLLPLSLLLLRLLSLLERLLLRHLNHVHCRAGYVSRHFARQPLSMPSMLALAAALRALLADSRIQQLPVLQRCCTMQPQLLCDEAGASSGSG